jgi:hypothetical protein
MRVRPFRPLATLVAAVFVLPLHGGLAHGQAGPSGTLEARVRALEARVTALEGRAGGGAAAPASAGVDCESFQISFKARGSRLNVTANGRLIGAYEVQGSPVLTTLLRPGANAVAFAYASPGDEDSLLQVYCTPPGAAERVEILRFKPRPGELQTRVDVNMVRAGR